MCCAHLPKCHSHTSNGMVVRSTLERGEDGEVDLVLEVVHDLLPLLVRRANTLTVEDEASPGQNRTSD